jgi:hypothetical protein
MTGGVISRGRASGLLRRGAGWTALVGLAAVGGMRALTLVPPASRRLPWGLVGPLGPFAVRASASAISIAVVAMVVCYLVLVWSGSRVPAAASLGVALALIALFTLVPPAVGHDVFSYVAYGRMAAQRLNPYTAGPGALGADPVNHYYAPVFHSLPTKYGPLFTLLCWALSPLGVLGAAWALKVLTGLAAAATLAVIHRGALRDGQDGTAAVVFVALNPLFLVYAVANAHNDVLMSLLLVVGVVGVAHRRDGAGLAAAVAASALKPSAVIAVPLLLVSATSRRAGLAAAAGATAAIAAVSVVAFGIPTRYVHTLVQHTEGSGRQSVPGLIHAATGIDLLTPLGRLSLLAAFLATYALLLALAWRRRMGPATSAGWAMAALLADSTIIYAWYIVWLLPLAALSTSRRLRTATLLLTAMFTALSPARRLLGL